MSNAQMYDTIGATYTVTRRTDPRIAARVWAALGDARTVLNVGAGTGSYEPPGRDVVAVEPSAVMRAQRPADAAPCVAAVAESLPFEGPVVRRRDGFATIDHWQDPIAGLREMRRRPDGSLILLRSGEQSRTKQWEDRQPWCCTCSRW